MEEDLRKRTLNAKKEVLREAEQGPKITLLQRSVWGKAENSLYNGFLGGYFCTATLRYMAVIF